MRRILSAGLLALMLLAFAGEDAQAARRARNGGNNARIFGGWQQRQASPGFFSNLMELERRKNAWLRRTFLGN